MELGDVVDWDQHVLSAWRRSSQRTSPNADVWGRLPPGVCWFKGRITDSDVGKLLLVGSEDWYDVFGSYRQTEVSRANYADDDVYGHKARVRNIRAAMSQGRQMEPLVLVADSAGGPFVLIDGNHRAICLHQLGKLVGQDCFVGFHHRMHADFLWSRRAVEQEGSCGK
jgi:hypothetical protein